MLLTHTSSIIDGINYDTFTDKSYFTPTPINIKEILLKLIYSFNLKGRFFIFTHLIFKTSPWNLFFIFKFRICNNWNSHRKSNRFKVQYLIIITRFDKFMKTRFLEPMGMRSSFYLQDI